MRARPRAAFVMTVSLLAGAACGKQQTTSGSTSSGSSTFECKPPDCHMNPPPQPTPSFVPPSTNPPAVAGDAGAPKAPKQ